jgi:DNA-binding response OmpR family regulator
LIIEDDATAVAFFEQVLVDAGYIVRTALTVDDGLAAARMDAPDAILLDLHLPVTDGLECLRRLRAAPLNLNMAVAIVTGDYFLDDEMARELQSLRASIHFKPVWDDDILRIVEALVIPREAQLQ